MAQESSERSEWRAEGAAGGELEQHLTSRRDARLILGPLQSRRCNPLSSAAYDLDQLRTEAVFGELLTPPRVIVFDNGPHRGNRGQAIPGRCRRGIASDYGFGPSRTQSPHIRTEHLSGVVLRQIKLSENGLAELIVHVLHDGDDQVVTASKVMDQSTLGHTGDRSDLSQRHGGTLREDHLVRRVENGAPRTLRVSRLPLLSHRTPAYIDLTDHLVNSTALPRSPRRTSDTRHRMTARTHGISSVSMLLHRCMRESIRTATVIVIGAGQAGLSAAYHLKERGFESALDAPTAERTYVVLDAEAAPGGAWQHRWASLRTRNLNGIFHLPGLAATELDPNEQSRRAVPDYFASFERRGEYPILRPVHVHSVDYADDDESGNLIVRTDHGVWRSRAIINATGTWNNPVQPVYPGQETFTGRQLHTRDYVALDEFTGLRVAIVGGGISAVQLLEEISRVATTFWYVRREPVFLESEFDPETTGRATIDKVTADVEAGRPSGSIVGYTGLGWTPYARAARDRGALVRRPMFTAIEGDGVREVDGTLTPVDVILWATGFRADLRHLDPLYLQNQLGGITMRGTQVRGEPRVHLIGFGPSQSTVGANRAGRDAVAALMTYLDTGWSEEFAA